MPRLQWFWCFCKIEIKIHWRDFLIITTVGLWCQHQEKVVIIEYGTAVLNEYRNWEGYWMTKTVGHWQVDEIGINEYGTNKWCLDIHKQTKNRNKYDGQ